MITNLPPKWHYQFDFSVLQGLLYFDVCFAEVCFAFGFAKFASRLAGYQDVV